MWIKKIDGYNFNFYSDEFTTKQFKLDIFDSYTLRNKNSTPSHSQVNWTNCFRSWKFYISDVWIHKTVDKFSKVVFVACEFYSQSALTRGGIFMKNKENEKNSQLSFLRLLLDTLFWKFSTKEFRKPSQTVSISVVYFITIGLSLSSKNLLEVEDLTFWSNSKTDVLKYHVIYFCMFSQRLRKTREVHLE